MDYTQTAYFTGAQPPYDQFIGIQPITPAHTNSVASDDYNTTSPPEVFEQYSGNLPHAPGTFQTFGNYVPFNGQPIFAGPPTPPDQQLAQPVNGAVAPPALLNAAPPSLPKVETEERNQRQGSNSEEDELTPAQSRRKAQNRAAQRAFRERKDRHLKDVENRLEEVERARQNTVSENEQLKRALQKANTEMEILRATSAVVATVGSPGTHGPAMTTGPMSYNPTDFYSEVLQGHANKSPSHRIVTSDDGERLLAAGAAWDLIINHDLFKRGLVDIANVSERLKSQAKCDGQGPVFGEKTILRIIETSVASGSDELL